MFAKFASAQCRRTARLSQCDSGASAVEFAFIFPLLFLLLVGIYSAGSVMHSISTVRYALEETARTLQLNPKMTQNDLQKAIDEKLANYGKKAVTLNMSVQKDASGSDVAHLSATYPFLMAVPFIPKFSGAYQQTVDIFLVIATP